MGLTYGTLGRYQEAIEAFKKAISLKPDDANAHFGLGLSYLSIGNRGSALDEYKILKSLDEKMADELFDRIYR
jgi:tetratricopeptide (TPR) repeat protein